MPTKCPNILTDREKEVLKYCCYNNSEISKMLKITKQTVKGHIQNIMDKLNCKGRSAAIIEAVNLGLINANEIKIKTKE